MEGNGFRCVLLRFSYIPSGMIDMECGANVSMTDLGSAVREWICLVSVHRQRTPWFSKGQVLRGKTGPFTLQKCHFSPAKGQVLHEGSGEKGFPSPLRCRQNPLGMPCKRVTPFLLLPVIGGVMIPLARYSNGLQLWLWQSKTRKFQIVLFCAVAVFYIT